MLRAVDKRKPAVALLRAAFFRTTLFLLWTSFSLWSGGASPDELRFEHVAHSRVEPLLVGEAHSRDGVLLPGARPADEAHSQVELLRRDAEYSPGAALLV